MSASVRYCSFQINWIQRVRLVVQRGEIKEHCEQWRSQDLLSSGAQNGRACAPAKILKPRPFPLKISAFRVYTRALHDQSRCGSAKDQYASEEAHAITTTRLPVVIVFVRQSIIWQGTRWFTV